MYFHSFVSSVEKIFHQFFQGFDLFGVFVSQTLMDSPEPWQIGFQDPATPIAQGIQDLHHDIFFFMIFILIFVVWMLARTLYHFHASKNPNPAKIIHGTTIEVAWTVTPSLILMVIALPSFALLYSMDEVVDPAMTFKAIGHQWYWTYEYSDYSSADDQSIVFDSYMIPEDDLEFGQLRLLEVDHRVVLPINTHVRVIVTAADVLHSWAIPSLGVKCDAVPGRLNQTSIFLRREGVFYGQCSELCGANHAFMPIVVEGVSLDDYISWVSHQFDEI
jgi:cytochrome c oxidase subunit 2